MVDVFIIKSKPATKLYYRKQAVIWLTGDVVQC